MKNENIIPTRNYEVRLEIKKLIDVKVTASDAKEAISKALKGNEDGIIDYIELQEI